MKHSDCQRNIIAATMWPQHSKIILSPTFQDGQFLYFGAIITTGVMKPWESGASEQLRPIISRLSAHTLFTVAVMGNGLSTHPCLVTLNNLNTGGPGRQCHNLQNRDIIRVTSLFYYEIWRTLYLVWSFEYGTKLVIASFISKATHGIARSMLYKFSISSPLDFGLLKLPWCDHWGVGSCQYSHHEGCISRRDGDLDLIFGATESDPMLLKPDCISASHSLSHRDKYCLRSLLTVWCIASRNTNTVNLEINPEVNCWAGPALGGRGRAWSRITGTGNQFMAENIRISVLLEL